jgi:hypothetical protein
MGGVVIGMDEAGYGPNLGPLVITATVWESPGPPADCDFWGLLAPCVRNESADDERLFIADSKTVYQPARGLADLEHGVLCLLAALNLRPRTFHRLRGDVCPASDGDGSPAGDAPWYASEDVPVPVAACPDAIERGVAALQHGLQTVGLRLQRILCDIVTEARFNRLIETCGNKGAALTEASLQLLRRTGCLDGDAPTCVLADKHGGRNQYSGVLSHTFDGRLPQTLEESRERSRYRLGAAEIRFQARAEEHLPVAAASMVSKYVREVAMTAFNRYWRRHLPDVKATAGYPEDARRFRRDIAAAQLQLGIPDHVLWRCR